MKRHYLELIMIAFMFISCNNRDNVLNDTLQSDLKPTIMYDTVFVHDTIYIMAADTTSVIKPPSRRGSRKSYEEAEKWLEEEGKKVSPYYGTGFLEPKRVPVDKE